MPSNFQAFDLSIDNGDGTTTALPDVTIKVYDATNVADLGDLVSDGDGNVAAGVLPVDAGTVVRFRVEDYLGLAGALEQVTT